MERTVLVTGAGSGIGLGSALEAARLGFRVVAAVHRDEQVPEVTAAAAKAALDGPGLEVEVLDVTDDDRAAEIIDRHRPWGLVNNAGGMWPGLLADTPPEVARRHVEVMVFAPLRLAQLALPGMRGDGGGRIVNVSSIASDVTGPVLGWYQAAKAALSSLSDALRTEVAHYGVEVVLVEPGPYATPIWDKALHHLAGQRAGALEPEVYDQAAEALDELRRRGADPGEVAVVVGAALRAGHPRFRYRVGPGANGLATLARAVPTSVRDRLTRSAAGL